MGEITQKYIHDLISLDPELSKFKSDLADLSVPVITDEVLQLIRLFIQSNQVRSILEIGTAAGASAIFFATFMGKNGHVTTIERDDRYFIQSTDNIKRMHLEDRIEIIHNEAGKALEELEGSYDMIFLDGAKAHYIHMLDDCIRLLKKNGLLIADNVLFRGMVSGEKPLIRRKITIVKRMRSFLDAISSDERLLTTVLPIGDGVSISVKK